MLQIQTLRSLRSVPWTTLGWAVGGPFALGGLTGLRHSGGALLSGALGMPAIAVGTTALMAPALYLSLALAGSPASSRHVVDRLGDALAATGRVQMGFAPAALFLAATAVSLQTAVLFVLLAMAAGLLVALRGLVGALAAEGGLRAGMVSLAWCVVALVVGGRLTFDLLARALS